MPSLTKHRTVPDGFVEPADIPTGWVSQLLDPVTPSRPGNACAKPENTAPRGVSGGSAMAAISE